MGEIRYVLGHLLGTAECALCDITHSPVRRKPEWDRMLARLAAMDGSVDAFEAALTSA